MIPTLCQWSRDPDIESSFASNRTSNIFHPKILHASFSASDLPRHRAPHRCHPHLPRTDSDTTYSRTDSDTTSHTSALALSGAKVLRVLRSQGQAACLMAGLREKTTYRSAPSWIRWWWSEGVPHALWKATGGATSKVVRRRLTGRGQAWRSGRQHQLLPPSLYGGPSSLCGGDSRRSRRNSRWSSGFMQMDPDGWLDVSAWFISWMRLRLGPFGLQNG